MVKYSFIFVKPTISFDSFWIFRYLDYLEYIKYCSQPPIFIYFGETNDWLRFVLDF